MKEVATSHGSAGLMAASPYRFLGLLGNFLFGLSVASSLFLRRYERWKRTKEEAKMPRRSKATAQTSQASAVEELDPIAAFNGAAAETFVRTCQAYTNGAATMNAEVMSFFNTRLTRDVELSQAVSKCENWAGIVDVQQQWARQATEEYFAGANKIMQLATKLTQESWEPVVERANQTITELNKPLS